MLGWTLIRIVGDSMRPLVNPGAFAVFRQRSTYATGDVVLVDHPRFGTIIKRAIDVTPQQLWLEGANSDSLSRETMGPVERRRIKGKLVFQIKRGG